MIAFLSLLLHVLILPFKTQARLESRDRPAASSVERAAPAHSLEAQAGGSRPSALRLALSPVPVGVERRNYCPARDDHPVASHGLPPVLALEVALAWRSAQGPARDPPPDPRDEPGQPTLGRAADPWRTPEARNRHRAVDGRQVHGQERPRAIADLEDFPSKPRGGHCRHGL